VLCGTDFSEPSGAAAAAGAAFARVLGEPLVLAHALGDLAYVLYGFSREHLLAAARERLDRDAARLALDAGVSVRGEVLEGSAAGALLDRARAGRASLLVVAAHGHGRGAVTALGLGSTAERLALRAPVPIVVTHDAAPFAAWARGERTLRVALAVDLDATTAPVVAWTGRLCAAAPCDVLAVHLYYADEAAERLGVAPAEVETLLTREVAAAVAPLRGTCRLDLRLERAFGRLADDLVRVAGAERADLVVVGTHHRRGLARLWSVSGGARNLASMAVATIPGGAGGEEELEARPP